MGLLNRMPEAMELKKMELRVGIFLGGLSSEREVSLNSGRNVYDNLDRQRYLPVPIYVDNQGRLWMLPWQLISQNTTQDMEERLAAEATSLCYEDLPKLIDFAFLALHGKYGEDGCVQGLLELLKIPYTGSGVLGSALGIDKHYQQTLLKAAGLDVPTSVLVRSSEWTNNPGEVKKRIAATLSYPLFVKPVREGSSIGVSLVSEDIHLDEAINQAMTWDKAILVEEYLKGIEFSCIVIEENDAPKPLEVTEIHPQGQFYDYDDKYMPGRCRKFTPPKNISADHVRRIKACVLLAFETLGFRSYGRIDGFFLPDGRVMITDPNSSSGMAPSSFFFEQAACNGLFPGDVLSLLIEQALLIHKSKTGPL